MCLAKASGKKLKKDNSDGKSLENTIQYGLDC